MYPSVRWCSTIKVLCSVHQMKQLRAAITWKSIFFPQTKIKQIFVQFKSVQWFSLLSKIEVGSLQKSLLIC